MGKINNSIINTILENRENIIDENIHDMYDKFCLINAPVLGKIEHLRRKELIEIRQTEEYKTFVSTLPRNQHITLDGYIISRQEIETIKEGLPGFEDEKCITYKYDNIPEDITLLFGSQEYCKQMKELSSQLISFDDFLNKYYIV